MRDRLRKIVLRGADWTVTKLPYLALMGRLNLFQSARATRRYLTGLCGGDLSPLPAEESKTPLSKARSVPAKIWYLADLYWEPMELIPELQKISEVEVTNLHAATLAVAPREKVVELVEAVYRDIRPDIILLYAREGLLSEALFQILRTKNVPIWGMNLDDKVEFFQDDARPFSGRDGYHRWARSFDLNLTCCRALVRPYQIQGGRAVYFPEGYHLRPEFEAPRPPLKDTIALVASRRDSRAALIEKLAQFGLRVQTYGNGWPGGTMESRPWQVYRSAQLVLGDGVTPSAHTTNLKPRDFETPGSNTCYITTYNWELADQFELGREILCYRDTNELVEMLAYYQARPEECGKIAQAGFERARADHTWEKRFRQAFADWL